MGIVRKHHELKAWQEAMEMVQDVYDLTKTFPKEEDYSLTSQIRRAAVSVPSNIAEGAARATDKEFLRFLSISRGSLSELETQMEIARRLGYTNCLDVFLDRVDRLFALINGLIRSLKKRNNNHDEI